MKTLIAVLTVLAFVAPASALGSFKAVPRCSDPGSTCEAPNKKTFGEGESKDSDKDSSAPAGPQGKGQDHDTTGNNGATAR